ncbi:MAG: hypothetical protein O2815_05845 [Actinomycetota bacterium]|nr:hypothetical protein [Actinomycetota bacterium]
MIAPAYVLRGALIASVSVLALTACSRPVAVQAPDASVECEPVLSASPIRLLGELQRETTPRNAAAIAWGDPPIVLACGIDHEVPADAQVITIEGIDWVAEETDTGTVFTTLSLVPTIQLRVPANYRPEVDAVVEITPALPMR